MYALSASPRKRGGIITVCLLLLAGLFAVAPVAAPPPAEARLATGGTGLYKSQIEWFEWGAAGEAIPDGGITKTNVVEVGGEQIEITCSLSDISRSRGNQSGTLLEAYRPGSWQNDGLDKMYNIGGTGRNNQLVSGISNRFDGNTISFNFSCSTSIGGETLPVPGLVMADAESSADPEYVEAKPEGNTTWRIIDRFRNGNCTNSTVARLSADNTLQLRGGRGECSGGGPTAVAFMEGATSARATIWGRGKSAIALGVMVAFDRTDTPASYVDAPHFALYNWRDGTITPGQDTQVNDSSFRLATQVPPQLTLGNQISEEPRAKFSADARGDNFDDAFGDENQGGGLSDLDLFRGREFKLPAGTCRDARSVDQRNGGAIRGWIDFNGNGTFDDGESSDTVSCSGTDANGENGSFQLTWASVPADTVPRDRSFVRLRYGANGNAVSSPTGFGGTGEVEDYAVRLNLPTLNLIKQLPERADGADQFAVSIGRDGDDDSVASAETSGEGTRAETDDQVVDDGTYTLTDTKTAGPTNFAGYAPAISCVDTANNNAAVDVTGSSPQWQISGLTPRQRVDCTITNRLLKPSITLEKTAGDASGAEAGDTIPYTFRVTNTGEVELSDVSVTDAKFVNDAGDSTVSCPQTTLAPGEAMDCTATYTLTQADVDAGRVDNTATTNGTSPGGQNVSATDDVSTPIPAEPAITIEKTATVSPSERQNAAQAGDRIAYSFVVRNTGNVTLNNVGVDDAAAGAVTCNTTTLAPGQETTCTADEARVVSQADVDAGTALTNTATSVGTPPNGSPVRSDPDTAEVPVVAPAPELTLVKTAERDGLEPDAPLAVGQEIRYSFNVTNTGNVTITEVAVTDAQAGAVTCDPTTLAPNEVAKCTADNAYVVTQEDVDRGTVTNTAQANGNDPSGNNVESNEDTVVVPGEAEPAMVLRKSAGTPTDVNGNNLTDAGDTIQYTFQVENTGNVTLTGVGIEDELVGPVTCDPTTLAPGDIAQCSADNVYTITQEDVDAGEINNTATANATDPDGNELTATDTTRTPTDATARLDLVKSAGEPVDANGNDRTDAGDTIAYTFTVTNTGTVTVSDVAVEDAKVGAVTCDPTTLAPGESATCTPDVNPYVITQADADAGSVNNTARASGTDPSGNPVDSPDASTSTPVPPVSELTMEKTAADPVDANGSGRTDAGDTVAYTFTVTNTGTTTITNVAIADDKVSNVTCDPLNLAAGEVATCTADPYVLTQDDADAGQVVNTATATGDDPSGNRVTSPEDSTTTPIAPVASLDLVKTAEPPVDANGNGRVDAGDTIRYTFEITNTGNVSLTGVGVSDAKVGAVTCDPTTLAPGAKASCTANELYEITQEDVDAGGVNNVATANGTPPTGDPVSSPPSETNTPVAVIATVEIDKRADDPVDVNGNERTDAGDTIQFRFTVTNTGTVSLTDIGVDDDKVGAVTCEQTTLAAGESTECAADAVYVITAADADAGAVTNTATAVGTPPGDDAPPVSSPPDTQTTVVEGDSAIELVKRAGNPVDVNENERTDVGDTIQYTFTVTNTGGLTLSNVQVRDSKAGAVTCAATTLAAGASTECSANEPYVITAEDASAGAVRNIASALGTDPTGREVGSPPDETVTPVESEIPVEPNPSILLSKRAGEPVDVNNNGMTDAGDTIAYFFTVTNNGDVALEAVGVTDNKVGSVTCQATELAPGAATECAADVPYTLTQADVDAGRVDNTATATGTPPGGDPVTSTPANVSTPVPAMPRLALDKRADGPADTNGSGTVDAGDEVTYTFVVTNTGNVTVTDVAVDDPKVGEVTCDPTTLAPGASVTCTAAPYAITAEDIEAGGVRNIAISTGTTPTGDPVESPPAEVVTPVGGTPRIELAKEAGEPTDVNENDVTDAGDEIQFTFTVTNTGTALLDDVVVNDEMAGAVTCEATSLEPGESTNCVADEAYVITQADADAGVVRNVATATGTPPGAPPITSTPAETETPVPGVARLELTKRAGAVTDVDNSGSVTVGDQQEFLFDLTNTGTVTLNDVVVDDPMLAETGLVASCPVTTLAPGESVTCVATGYTITADDGEAGKVTNAATARGKTPPGMMDPPTPEVVSNTSEVEVPVVPAPPTPPSPTPPGPTPPGPEPTPPGPTPPSPTPPGPVPPAPVPPGPKPPIAETGSAIGVALPALGALLVAAGALLLRRRRG